MQLSWLVRGLRTGVLTTRYPRAPELLPTGFRGRPVLEAARCRAADGCDACVRACLPNAITVAEGQDVPQIAVNYCAWPRVPSGNPRPSITGELAIQPPEGVAAIIRPPASIASRWDAPASHRPGVRAPRSAARRARRSARCRRPRGG